MACFYTAFLPSCRLSIHGQCHLLKPSFQSLPPATIRELLGTNQLGCQLPQGGIAEYESYQLGSYSAVTRHISFPNGAIGIRTRTFRVANATMCLSGRFPAMPRLAKTLREFYGLPSRPFHSFPLVSLDRAYYVLTRTHQ